MIFSGGWIGPFRVLRIAASGSGGSRLGRRPAPSLNNIERLHVGSAAPPESIWSSEAFLSRSSRPFSDRSRSPSYLHFLLNSGHRDRTRKCYLERESIEPAIDTADHIDGIGFKT